MYDLLDELDSDLDEDTYVAPIQDHRMTYHKLIAYSLKGYGNYSKSKRGKYNEFNAWIDVLKSKDWTNSDDVKIYYNALRSKAHIFKLDPTNPLRWAGLTIAFYCNLSRFSRTDSASGSSITTGVRLLISEQNYKPTQEYRTLAKGLLDELDLKDDFRKHVYDSVEKSRWPVNSKNVREGESDSVLLGIRLHPLNLGCDLLYPLSDVDWDSVRFNM